MRYGQIVFALLASVIFTAEVPANAATLQLKNEITLQHIQIPDTGVFFVPASDLSLSKKHHETEEGQNGIHLFTSNRRHIEVAVVNIHSTYMEMLEKFSDSTLLSHGIEVKSRGEMNVNGHGAVLIKALHKNTEWAKWIMLLDKGDSTVVVNGAFTSGNADAAKDIEKMLKSVVVVQNKNDEQKENTSR